MSKRAHEDETEPPTIMSNAGLQLSLSRGSSEASSSPAAEMSKRAHVSDSPLAGTPDLEESRSVPHFVLTSEPVSFSRVTSIDELDKRVLQLQNQKLYEALSMNKDHIAELRTQIVNAEKRQANDDELLCVVNRYWNQMDEDCMVLVERFETDVAEEVSASTESFLRELASWDKEDVSKKLEERVYFSKRIISRLLSAFDRLLMRQDRLRDLLGQGGAGDQYLDAENRQMKEGEAETGHELVQRLRKELAEVVGENSKLHFRNNSLHERQHTASLKIKELEDACQAATEKAAEWQAKFEDADYKWNQAQHNLRRLDLRLSGLIEQKKTLEEEMAVYKAESAADEHKDKAAMLGGISSKKFNDMAAELEEARELANTRLNELERLQRRHEEKTREAARLAMQLRETPESVIVESPPYKSLLAQFNILYNEVIHLREQLDESRSMLLSIRQAHAKQLDTVEKNETVIMERMRQEMLDLEESLSQQKKASEKLEMEYDLATAHCDQEENIKSEMRSLISTLQTQNKQSKAEVVRLRRKCKELTTQLDMMRVDTSNTDMELAKTQSTLVETTNILIKQDEPSLEVLAQHNQQMVKLVADLRRKLDLPVPPEQTARLPNAASLTPEMLEFIDKQLEPVHIIYVLVNDLMKLGAATCLPKESPDPGSRIWASLLIELTQLRQAIGRLFAVLPPLESDNCIKPSLQDSMSEEGNKMLMRLTRMECEQYSQSVYRRDWAVNRLCLDLSIMQRKLQQVQEQVQMTSQLYATAQQQEEMLVKEMEVTEQAFGEAQEQNARLVETLREKEDAHLKQMTDLIKSTQAVRMLREEKRLCEDRDRLTQAKVEALSRAVQKQEEKEKLLLTNLGRLEREASLRQQAQEAFKRKSVENQQVAEDLRVTVQKYLSQLKDAQGTVQEKVSSYERAQFRQQRLQEELVSLRRKVDRLKRIEQSSNADEVILAEIQDYKELLTCPTCKTNRKDAILTKCFHVFCLQCLKTRYETRNRKCPRCNALFGANDYHRIYLT
ncbi:E3 ubiquitin-protein ligase bre1 [Cichlidogyrus casuarinus]|uniref:E3 ubiquitin protein ligase n=1 Tax=Cichlidogyrus casuarinus TaxID=1844966 RepID=A0ABD2Q9P7_9PLAT